MTWSVYIRGKDPELDKIVSRRFGSRHEKPCNNPNVLTCAVWECQKADCCQRWPQHPNGDKT
ncbi:hypothetical protein ACVWZ4_007227 [Bradyrhizobium sp. USDA 4472]